MLWGGTLNSFWKCEFPRGVSWWNDVADWPSSVGMLQIVMLALLLLEKLWKNLVLLSPAFNQMALLLRFQVSSRYFRILALCDSKPVRWVFASSYKKPLPCSSIRSAIWISMDVRAASSLSLFSLAHFMVRLLILRRFWQKPLAVALPHLGGWESQN